MFNVDDVATLYINGEATYKARWGHLGTENNWNPFGHKPGDSGEIDITSYLESGDNSLKFELWNNNSCCMTSISIQVKENNSVIFSDSLERRDSNEGIKYDKTITIVAN